MEQRASHKNEEMGKENIAGHQQPESTTTTSSCNKAMDILKSALNDTMESNCDLINSSIISCNNNDISASASFASSPINKNKQNEIFFISGASSNNSSTLVSPVKKESECLLFRAPSDDIRAKYALEQLAAIVTSSAINSPSKKSETSETSETTAKDTTSLTKQEYENQLLKLDDEIQSLQFYNNGNNNNNNNHIDSSTTDMNMNISSTCNTNSEEFYDCASPNNDSENNIAAVALHDEKDNDINNDKNDSVVEEVSKRLSFLQDHNQEEEEESVEVSFKLFDNREQHLINDNNSDENNNNEMDKTYKVEIITNSERNLNSENHEKDHLIESYNNDTQKIDSHNDVMPNTEVIKNENELATTSSAEQNLQRRSRLDQIKQRLNANKSRYGTNTSIPNEDTNMEIDDEVNTNAFVSNNEEMPISNENTNITVISNEYKNIDIEEVKNDKKHESDNYKETIQNLEKKYKTLIEEINESHKKEVQDAAENATRIEQEKHNKITKEVIQKYENTMQKMKEENNEKIQKLESENNQIQNSHIMEIDQMAKDIDAFELDFNEKTDALQVTIQEKNVAIRELSKQLADINQKEYVLESKLEECQYMLNESNQEIHALQNHLNELLQVLESEKREHMNAKEQFEEQKLDAIEKVTLDLKSAAETQFNEANLIYMNLQSEYETLKEDYDTLKNSLECEKMKVELVQKEKKALEVSKNGISTKFKAASQRYSCEIQQHIDYRTKLEHEKESVIKNLESMQIRLDQITNLKEEIAKENIELNKICEELMAELESKQ